MALMNCPECGKEISDTVKCCPGCGYRLEWKRGKKKIVVIVCVLLALIIAGTVTAAWILGVFGNSTAKQAITILKNDYGKSVNVVAVYYNEELNGCIIEFSSNGRADTACVDLTEQVIGYESEFENLSDLMYSTSSNSKKQQYALQLISYPYDPIWVYNLTMNSTEESGWEKIK